MNYLVLAIYGEGLAFVMAVLVMAIQVFLSLCGKDVDARDKLRMTGVSSSLIADTRSLSE